MFNRQEFLINPARYVETLAAAAAEHPTDVEVLADYTEGLFEIGEAEKALPVLQKIFSVDKEANDNFKVFLWAGQIFGGRNGLAFYERALILLNRLLSRNGGGTGTGTSTSTTNEEVKLQISQTHLAMIEIWMTDLCMEPEAESTCERLIGAAMLAADIDPEVWSVLASIRLSQLRTDDAREALTRSWSLFQAGLENGTIDSTAIPKLIRLAQSMVETMQIEEMMQVTSAVQALDDLVPESYYLVALGHNLMLDERLSDIDASMHIIGAREAADALVKISEDDANSEIVDPAIVEAVLQIKNDLPQPKYEEPWELLEDAGETSAAAADDAGENQK